MSWRWKSGATGWPHRIQPDALDQMLAGYQQGAALLAFCRKRLDAVQDQIKVLDEGGLQAWGQE